HLDLPSFPTRRSSDLQTLRTDRDAGVSPYLFVLGAAVLWSTGGLFIKLGKAGGLSDAELSCGRALFSAATVMLLTRREGFGLNRDRKSTRLNSSHLVI